METLDKPKSDAGMTSLEIKFHVYRQWGTITAGARVLNCSRSQLSYCIARRRKSPELREKLARALDIPIEKLFGRAKADTVSREGDRPRRFPNSPNSINSPVESKKEPNGE